MEVGKNDKDNSRLIKEASNNHLWFHLDSGPSPHVVLKDDHTKENIVEAALLCKSKSKMKHNRKVRIIYCEIRNLKNGRKPGEVIIRQRKKCKIITV
jgi:predicted ribosome quality control (RQC) complex YloA/Tae2 family protein